MATNALTINGKINIPKGTINLDNQNTVLLVKSKDIIFNNHINIHSDNNLKILPTSIDFFSVKLLFPHSGQVFCS